MSFFKIIWKNKYIIHEILETNHNNSASIPINIHYIKSLRYCLYLYYDKSVIDCAAKNGYLSVIKWITKKNNRGCTTAAMDYAAMNGHLSVVKWLHKHRKEGCTTAAMDYAAMNGHLHVIQWLYYNRTEGCTRKAFENAIYNGHLHVVQWLYNNTSINYRFTLSDIELAINRNHLELFVWLYEHYYFIGYIYPIDYAAEKGNIKLVKWLHYNGYESTTKAMDYAAANGHLNIVKWLHYNRTEGCTTAAMDSAAKNMHYHIVDWLISHRKEGCSDSGNQYIVNYLIKNEKLKKINNDKFNIKCIEFAALYFSSKK